MHPVEVVAADLPKSDCAGTNRSHRFEVVVALPATSLVHPGVFPYRWVFGCQRAQGALSGTEKPLHYPKGKNEGGG